MSRPSAAKFDRKQGFPAEIYQNMAELGLFGITAPETDGGTGIDAPAYLWDGDRLGKRIIDNQGMQRPPAEMAKDIALIWPLTHRGALLIENDQPAKTAFSMAKCLASDVTAARTADAVQMSGGSSYIRGFEIERLSQHVKITRIDEGIGQIQCTIIARELNKNGARQ